MSDKVMPSGSGDGHTLSGSFKWLNATQFLGALNDNILKLFIVFFLIGVKGPAEAGTVSATAGGVFVLPFLIFSAWAGVIADRFSKRTVTVIVKTMELAVVTLAVFAFYTQSETGLYAVLFLMGTHSAFFAPSKYGIVPEIVGREQLSSANGLLESFTYLAVILGSALSPLLAEAASLHYDIAALFCVGIAAAGLFSSRNIKPTPPAGSHRPFSPFILGDIWRALKFVGTDSALLLAVLGSAYFMFVGAFAQINLIPYGMEVLGLTQEKSGYLFFVGALAIGGGSLLSGRLSGRGVEFGVVPLGALGITVSSIALYIIPASLPLIVASVFLLGFSAGLFIVPLQTFIQMRSPRERLGEVLAASGFLNWIGVLLAAVAAYSFSSMRLSAAHGFMITGVITIGLTLMAIKALPVFLIRFIALVVTRLSYRIRVTGGRNIPMDGPAVIIPNHVSWVDPLVLMATTPRRIRFVMDRGFHDRYRPTRALFRLMGVIPVSEKDSQRQIIAFVKEARKALADGYLLCIFAEGAITRNGTMYGFKPGFELVVHKLDCPIIPVYLGGLWGSVFSHAHGRLLSVWPSIAPRRVSIIVGEPMPVSTEAAEVRQAVMLLSTSYFESLKDCRGSLGRAFIASARKHWRRQAISDTTGKSLTYGKTLAAAIALGGEIDKAAPGRGMVGLLLPASVGGALANIAVILRGRVPVNLNYTASKDAVRSAIEQCGITHVITSRAFVEKTGFTPPAGEVIFIDDIANNISGASRIITMAKARFMPGAVLAGGSQAPDELATVIFSSGSSGEPKGVMLTHHNILSNIEGLQMVLRVTPADNICAALPLFHSLGFTGTLWLPLLSGFNATYHPNPLEGGKIAEVVRTNRSTLLLATPTFLTLYSRAAKPEDFSSLRLVVSGAEKLGKGVSDMFRDRFGITPHEGYGATELSPVVAIALPDVEVDGVKQTGCIDGSVGRPLPGISIRIADPDTGILLPPGVPGMILVKGPNLMKGYIGQPEKTADAIRDGWYTTGDIGTMSADGFLSITDRLARFSKIGGEMVPHSVIEDALHARLGCGTRVLAVVSVPDDKKGERILVLYRKSETDADALRAIMAELPFPNLWKPARNGYLEVDSFPILGSGKLDIQALKKMAAESFPA